MPSVCAAADNTHDTHTHIYKQYGGLCLDNMHNYVPHQTWSVCSLADIGDWVYFVILPAPVLCGVCATGGLENVC